MLHKLKELTETKKRKKEIMEIAIAAEEGRRLRITGALRRPCGKHIPAPAQMFEGDGDAPRRGTTRDRCVEMFAKRFGDQNSVMRRENVKGS